MRVPLRCGHAEFTLEIGAGCRRVDVLMPGRSAPTGSEEDLLREGVAHPIESRLLREVVTAGQNVAIVTSDITRPCPSDRLLPPLLEELSAAGISDERITVYFGLGLHRRHTQQEQIGLVGRDVFHRLRCVDADASDFQTIGSTSRGTPVSVARQILAADCRVLLGVIEYHYFAGYSGGYKALVPGTCAAETVQHNHRLMIQPGAVTGRLDGNPVREDIDEAGALAGADFILNVILDEAKRIVGAVAGHPRAAHRAGCAMLDSFGRATVAEPADIVVVSAGGYPKDINLYQAQKALDNARMIVRRGGVIVLVAECSEGMGNRTFEEYMRDPGGSEAIIARIRSDFVLGGHKAAAVALAMREADVYLVSSFEPAFARSLGFHPYADVNEALRAARTRAGPRPAVAVMPQGGSVLPALREG